MEPINSFLGRLVFEEITPVVMVLSTPYAEEACQKNGLTFIQMLEPFSLFTRLDVPVRTASDQPYRLQMFKLRLVYASGIHAKDYKAAEDCLRHIVSDASKTSFSDLRSDRPNLESVLNTSGADFPPLWIQTFNKELIRTVSFSEHEAFDHPIACLLVVSSKDEQPINKFIDLFNTDQLPSLLNDGAMDPKILKQYVLVHDNRDGKPERAMAILAEMRGTFGSNDCRLLSINSAEDGDHEWGDNPWAPYRSHSFTSHNIAFYLDNGDANEIKDFMQELSSKHIIPYMEQKVRVLNQQVSATRKGFRNQIKNLWWRKGKDDIPENPDGPMYSFSSIESQMRVLGDYAFMLRDYELALSNYRLLSTDYKLDKAWKRYAGVQEMLGLSYFMLDQSRKEAEYCMENAFNTYLRIGSAQRNATRCGIWWAEMLKAREQYKEAAAVYFRISTEEPTLHAAVMLEQASYCYLFSTPPMLRKYGFNLVLAGNRYEISDQRQHAIRAYRNALFVYKEQAWSYIHNHVHFNMGRWYALLGMPDIAIKHMLEALECSPLPLKIQNALLGDFLQTAQNLGKAFEVPKLQLPVISMSSAKVVYEDQRTYATLSDIGVPEGVWKSLEEDMVPSVSTIKYNWLDSQSQHKKPKDSCICVVGEAIKLELEFKNPLQISISAANVSLICEFSAKSEPTMTATDAEDAKSTEFTNFSEQGCASFLELSKFDVVLDGGETKRIQLDVTPGVEGILKIVGVKWMLSGSVVGYHYFEVDTKKNNKKGWRRTFGSLNANLKFVVIKGLPKLEGCIHGMPKKVYAGDMRFLKLELKNSSKYHVKKMKMKISHPRFLIPGYSGEVEVDFPGYLQKHTSGGKFISESSFGNSKSTLFSFPQEAHIQGEANFTWPLWLHCGLSGKISLYISIYYEMDGCSSDMTYRTLRMHYEVEVLPSLEMSFLMTPCSSRLEELLVRMDIANKGTSESFQLRQLSSSNDNCKISLLPSDTSISTSKTLLPGQEFSCFFKLKDYKSGKEKENDSAKRSDVLLVCQAKDEVLTDVSRSPLADFHYHERLHQGKAAKESQTSIDFILISKLQKSSTDLEAGVHPQLLVHYACNCSITSKSPIWWLMDGPNVISHDFSNCFCEVALRLTIHNSVNGSAHVKIVTSESMREKSPPSTLSPVSDSSQSGWHDISMSNDIKVVSSLQGSPSSKPPTESLSSFIWSRSTTQVSLGPVSISEVPLRVCIFSPGTYDLSSYELQWKIDYDDMSVSSKELKQPLSGTSQGHPFYLTVLQSP